MEKLYVRFGEIPTNGKSKIFKCGEVVGEEQGISVWDCVQLDGQYRIVVPCHTTQTALIDLCSGYFSNCGVFGEKKAYIVTGTELCKGSVGEPVLSDVEIIEELPMSYFIA